jgi:hypothetical protein
LPISVSCATAVAPVESVTCTEKGHVPLLAGVPEVIPLALSVRPLGSVPPAGASGSKNRRPATRHDVGKNEKSDEPKKKNPQADRLNKKLRVRRRREPRRGLGGAGRRVRARIRGVAGS